MDDQEQNDEPKGEGYRQYNGEIWYAPPTVRSKSLPLNPTLTHKQIMEAWYEEAPKHDTNIATAKAVAQKVMRKAETVLKVVKAAKLKEQSKILREQIAEEVYGEKTTVAKSIVGKSLLAVDEFLNSFKPQCAEDAKALVHIATNLTQLMRLELGKPTQSIEIIQKTQKDVTVILEELKKNDPFVDYPDGK